MKSFEEELYESKLVIKKNPERVFFAEKRIKNIASFINKIKNRNPNLSTQEIRIKVHNYLIKEANRYSKIGKVLTIDQLEAQVINNLLSFENNKEIINNLIDKNREKPNHDYIFNNYDKLINLTISRIIDEVDKICKNGKIDKKTVENIYKTDENYKKAVYIVIEDLPEILNKKMKEEYVELLINMKSYFSDFNLLEEYSQLYSQNMKKIGLEGLEYKVTSDNKKEFTMEKFFEQENLMKLEFSELIYNSMFWNNKYAKESKGILDALSIIEQNNLWQDIIDNKKITLNSKQKMNSLIRKEILDRYGKERLTNYNQNKEKIGRKESNKYQEGNKEIYNAPPKDKKDIKLEKSLEEQYNRYFSYEFEKKVNLSEDIKNTYVHYYLDENIYLIKNSLMANALLELENDKKVKNWGYIPQGLFNDSSNDIKRGKKYILFGIDYEGYNLPLTVHIDISSIIQEFELLGEIPLIPIYYGNEDLKINERYLPTNVYFPLQKKQKGYIINSLKKGRIPNKYRGIVTRIESLLPGKTKYLKQNNLKYINVKTAEIYKENIQNEEIDEGR